MNCSIMDNYLNALSMTLLTLLTLMAEVSCHQAIRIPLNIFLNIRHMHQCDNYTTRWFKLRQRSQNIFRRASNHIN
jgi:hypothetical protein